MERSDVKIWSKRFSVAKGNHWVAERDCTESNAKEWLAIFQADEPNVLFLASNRKPSLR